MGFFGMAAAILRLLTSACAGQGRNSTELDRQTVINQTMHPLSGPSIHGGDTATLKGKVMCGYQGWFAARGDDGDRGWSHWGGKNGFQPGSCGIDLWPDVSELDPDERYATSFRHADGRSAEVFSAYNGKTVLLHFRWMKDHGIDGSSTIPWRPKIYGTSMSYWIIAVKGPIFTAELMP